MRSTPLIVATATLALAACGQKTSTTTTFSTNSTTGTVTTSGDAPVTATSLGIQPGKWETTITTLDMTTTGEPADMPKGMVPQKPGPRTIAACVTSEQASKGPGEMLQEALGKLKKAGIDCTITNQVSPGGKMESEGRCKLPSGMMTSRTTGTYTPTEISYDSESSRNMGPVTAVTKTHTVSRRVGDCDK